MSFKKVLIVNRGEIALRAIQVLKELGCPSVLGCSVIDQQSLAASLADEVICLGGNRPQDSYLNIPRIISAAKSIGADAIYPGYGFLAENQKFIEICKEYQIQFIGPSSEMVQLMGDKNAARDFMQKKGIPIVPGSKGLKNEVEALNFAKEIGFPLLIKASAGGGGRGMRLCFREEDFISSFNEAKLEAHTSFGNEEVYLEKYVQHAKHYEVQIMADQFGNVVHFFGRDCSIQRRHQKLIEEAPGNFIDPEKTNAIFSKVVDVLKDSGYVGAGTLEFVYDMDAQEFYFIEMNTRIQVEHPISEMITGFDLVRLQFLCAMGERFTFTQKDIQTRGYAIECRINAEDPFCEFKPNLGTIGKLFLPTGFGVRVDGYIFSGYSVSPYYDSLLAKLIVVAENRQQAILKMKGALSSLIIENIKTTKEFHFAMMEHPLFLSGNYTTKILEDMSFLHGK